MGNFRIAAGGGLVADWRLEAALDNALGRLDGLRRLASDLWARVDLRDIGGQADHARRWPVRNQGHRSTCTAFAVVAAEELWHWRQTGSLVPLSEELLYRDLRAEAYPVTDPGLGLSQIAALSAAAAESGTTFLAQALRVLAAGRLRPAAEGPYEAASGLKKNHVTTRPVVPGLAPVTSAGVWQHNIAKNSNVLDGVAWFTPRADKPWALSSLLHDRLLAGVPVMVALALPAGVGIDAFIGGDGRYAGVVRFPPLPVLRDRGAQPTAGHCVCLVGFRPGPGGTLADGHFLARNSLGTVRQSAFAGGSHEARLPDAPGYVWIRVADLEVLCWEFLFRA